MNQFSTKNGTTGTNRAPGVRAKSSRWPGLVVTLVAVLVDMIDNQIVTVALPTIQHRLGASDSGLQWVSASYALGFALTLITGARLGDRFGYRTLFVSGMIVFTTASLAAGLAPSAEVLIVARIAQGIGSGLMVPQVLSFIQTEFQGAEQGKAMSLYTLAFPLGGLAGPLLGGILTQSNLFGLSWRSVFFVNVPIGLCGIVGALLTMPPRRIVARHRFDVLGLLLLTVALVAVFFPIIQGRELGWPWWAVALMVASLPLFAIFFAVLQSSARRGAEPLIDPVLLRSRSLLATQSILFIVNASVSIFFVLTLHLQNFLGFQPLQAALTFLPATLGIVAGNMLAFRYGARFGRMLTAIALAALLLSLVVIAILVLTMGRALSAGELLAPAVFLGLGMGMALSSLFGSYFRGVGPEQAGGASGVVNTTVQLGMASGIAVFGSVYFGNLGSGSSIATGWSLLCSAAMVGLGLIVVSAISPRAASN
ncbi:MAG TPA: MFS transporter [Galbitalea sp.]|jgi:EmrB/QacA subfamily drug resistance transporter|nr:MFS transporter [Galbitalea sp.]